MKLDKKKVRQGDLRGTSTNDGFVIPSLPVSVQRSTHEWSTT